MADADLHRGRERFEHFLEKAFATPELLARLDRDAQLWRPRVLDIFEHSPYFADELLRYPELLDEIGEPFQLEGGPLRGRRRAAPFLPAPDAAHPVREHARRRADLRHAGEDLACWPTA